MAAGASDKGEDGPVDVPFTINRAFILGPRLSEGAPMGCEGVGYKPVAASCLPCLKLLKTFTPYIAPCESSIWES